MPLQQRLRGLIFIDVLLASPLGPAHANDFGYWSNFNFIFKINPQWSFTFYPEILYDQDASRLNFFSPQFIATYHAGSHLDLGAGYGYFRLVRADGTSYISQNWEWPEATLKGVMGRVPMSFRNRVEFRQMNNATNRYRGKVVMLSPWTLTPLNIRPYVAQEYFYDFTYQRINQTRTFGGMAIPLNASTQLSVYFMRWGLLTASTDVWKQSNILGTEFRFLFGS